MENKKQLYKHLVVNKETKDIFYDIEYILKKKDQKALQNDIVRRALILLKLELDNEKEVE